MKIGIFGGSFNPPHKMHEEIANKLINRHAVDKVMFVPTGCKYKYKDNLVDDRKRYEMVKIITDQNDNFDVSDYEQKDYVVYTCDTLEYFKRMYPGDEIYFICGTDNLSYIDKWKNGESILRNYKILVIDRTGNDVSELLDKFNAYKENIIVAPVELRDISSTEIRNLVVEGAYEKLEGLVDTKVIEYIKINKLYENGEDVK